LQIADCGLRIAACPLSIRDCGLPIAEGGLRIVVRPNADRKLRTLNQQSAIAKRIRIPQSKMDSRNQQSAIRNGQAAIPNRKSAM
jgi:hypothetical protein